MKDRVRIADVAAAAGVSTATVSRALSNPARVGAEMRERVMAAVGTTGYRINHAARDLRQARARSILVLAPNLANTFFSRIVAAIQDVAGAAGLAVQISDSRAGGLESLSYDCRADGIILLDGTLEPELVAAWQVPIVTLCEWNDAYDLPGLGIDNAGAARLAVDHLADLGHRSVLHVAGPPRNVLGITRGEGFAAAVAARGLTGRTLPGDFTMESGAAAARVWAGMNDRPSAVFAASDECAMGFISECAAMGLSVPGDVSVVGFDDIDFAGRFLPPLTTVHQPRSRMGREAAHRMVAALLDGKRLPDGRQTIDAHLVVRGSTRPISG